MQIPKSRSDSPQTPAQVEDVLFKVVMGPVWMQAWVFGALDDEQRAPIYYTNAVVYLLPWLSRGFELDRFSIACLVAGVLHVQVHGTSQYDFCAAALCGIALPRRGILAKLHAFSMAMRSSVVQLERVAQTEPENFQLPSPGIVKLPLRQAARALTVCPSAPSPEPCHFPCGEHSGCPLPYVRPTNLVAEQQSCRLEPRHLKLQLCMHRQQREHTRRRWRRLWMLLRRSCWQAGSLAQRTWMTEMCRSCNAGSCRPGMKDLKRTLKRRGILDSTMPVYMIEISCLSDTLC